MFEIDDYKEGQSCTMCDKEASLIVSCKLGSMSRVPMCTKCLTRQCKARAASKPAPTHNGQPVTSQ